MGRQINYYMTLEDHFVFEERLCGGGAFIAISRRSNEPRLKEIDLASERDVRSLYLVRPDDLEKILTEEIPTRREYVVDGLYSPVIEYSRCYQGEGFIRPGRLYFQEGYFNQAGRWVTKDEAFVGWAHRSLRRARDFFAGRRDAFYYIGEQAEAARSRGVKLLRPWEGP